MASISIADGHEFPKLQEAIDQLWDQFRKVHQITRILNDQNKVNDAIQREEGMEIMSAMLKSEMDVLSDNVNELINFHSTPWKQAA